MNERDFDVLLAIEKFKNITKASESLYMTQSAISKRIAAIENELQIIMLIRSRNGVHFTGEGEEVMRSIHLAQGILSKMRERLNYNKDIVSGNLTVGVSINYTLYRLPKILAEFHKLFPEVTLHITTENSRVLYNQLLSNQLDLAIIRGEFPWNGIKQCIAQEHICAIRSKKNLGVPFDQLNYIGRKTDLSFEKDLVRWFHENNIRPIKRNVFVDNLTACVELVNASDSWAIVPEICLANFEGYIDYLTFSDGSYFTRPTYIMYPTEFEQLPQVREFAKVISSNGKV